MIYGDARVSTAAQDLIAQRVRLDAAWRGRVFCEKIIGANPIGHSFASCWRRCSGAPW